MLQVTATAAASSLLSTPSCRRRVSAAAYYYYYYCGGGGGLFVRRRQQQQASPVPPSLPLCGGMPSMRIRFFHATAVTSKRTNPKNRSPEWYLLKTTKTCPLCYKKFKARKHMLQHLFDPLVLQEGHNDPGGLQERLPKEVAVSLMVEATKRLGPKHN